MKLLKNKIREWFWWMADLPQQIENECVTIAGLSKVGKFLKIDKEVVGQRDAGNQTSSLWTAG